MTKENELKAALQRALPILEDYAEDERTFWGTEDCGGCAAEAESILEQARKALE